jgi:hypothetical protein
MRKLLILAVVILGLGVLIAALPALAQPPPLQYQEALSLSAITADGTASGSFTVTAGEADITNLQFTLSSLTDAEGNVAVAAEAVTVNPAQLEQLEASTSLIVTVSIAILPEPGSYEGSISITYAEQPEGTVDAIALTLSVEPEAATGPGTGPALRVEPEGQPLLLLLTSDGQNYRGSIAVTSLLTEVIGLKLRNFTDLVPTKGTAPLVLGADVMVNPSEPQTLGPGETQRFAITFPKPSLPANYRGSVEIVYDGKPLEETYVVELELIATLPTITIEPSDHILTLIQEGQSGPYKATFSLGVTEGEVSSVTFTKSNLDRTDGEGCIFADEISIDPTSVTVGSGDPPANFTISVAVPPEEGTYEGTLLLSYFGTAAAKAQGTISLTLRLSAALPAITIEPARTLTLTQEGQSGPYKATFWLGVDRGEVSKVAFTENDLDQVDGAGRIPGDQITVTPNTAAVGSGDPHERFTISAAVPPEEGTYEGTLLLSYFGTAAAKAQGTISLTLRLSAALPAITIEPARTLTLTQETKSGPYKASLSLGVTEGKVTDVAFTKHNLYEVSGGKPVFADKITVTPDTATVSPGDPPKSFTISVEVSQAGTYEGRLDLSFFGTAADQTQGIVTLTLRLIAAPEANLALSSPAKVQLKAYVGQQITQTVKIKETSESNEVNGIDIVRENLKGKEDQTRSMPAEVISLIQGAETTVLRGETSELPLIFDFDVKGVQAGEFSGNITVTSDNAPDLEIPVEVTLKHNWPLPMLALGLGVFVGLSLTWYQSQQRKKDELEVSIKRWEAKLDHLEASPNQHDQEFIEFWGPAAKNKLGDAKTNLDTNLPDGMSRAEALVKEVQRYFTCSMDHHVQMYEQWQRALDRIQEWRNLGVSKYKYAQGILASLGKIEQERANYADDAAMRAAIDAEESKFTSFHKVYLQGTNLEQLLDALSAQKELEGEVVKRYRDRITDQREALKEVDDGSKLQPIKAAFDQIWTGLDQDYQAYPHLYYRACKDLARDILEQIRKDINKLAAANEPPHWQKLTSIIQIALDQANEYYNKQVRFEAASRLAHNAWRAAWFYKNVILVVRKTLPGKDTTREPWKAVLATVEGIERWLVATPFGEQGIDAFHQQLLVTSMTSLYEKLSQAQGKLIEGPATDPLPIKPYRDLDKFHTVPAVAFGAGVSQLPKRGTAGRLSEPEEPTRRDQLVALLGELGKVILRILSSFFGDPRVRILSVEAIATFVTIVAMAYFGMKEMWFDQPTFGKNGWLDYFPLAFWGFAANATKDSVLRAIKGLGGLGSQIPIQ